MPDSSQELSKADERRRFEEVWSGHMPTTTGYRKLLLGLFLAGLATFAQLYSPQGLLPLISQDMGVTADQAALLVSAATLGLAIAVIPWSFVGDKLGRKKTMGIAIVTASIFSIAALLSPSFEWMIIFRGLEGLFLGGVPALAMAYLNEEVHRTVAAQAAGTFIAGTVVGGLVGRVVATPIGDWLHWRTGMATVVVISVVAAVGFLWLSPAARRFSPAGHSFKQAIQAITGNLRSKVLLVMYLQGMLLMGGFVAVYNYLGFHLTEEPYNLPVTVVSMLFLAYLAGTWSSPWAGKMATRFGPSRVLLVSNSVLIVTLMGTLVPNIFVVLVSLVIFTGAFFASHSVASGWAGSAALGGRAQSTALYNLCYYTGSSLFGWLGGVFLAQGGWFGTVAMTGGLALTALLLVLYIYVSVVIPRARRAREENLLSAQADSNVE